MSEPLLEVKNLKTYFPIKGGVFSRTIGHVKAVDGVSFTIDKGEVFRPCRRVWKWENDDRKNNSPSRSKNRR